MGGDDILRHTERCCECGKKQDEIYDNLVLTDEERNKLSQEIYECYCNSF